MDDDLGVGRIAPEGIMSLLFSACFRGDARRLALLLTSAGDSLATSLINRTRADGSTLLMIASRKGSATCLRVLLAANAMPSKPLSDGISPLYTASQRGHTECVRLLLAAQAAVDHPIEREPRGTTPLMTACSRGHCDCVRLLLAAAASVDHANDDDGFTPLIIASQKGRTKCVQMLLEARASVELPKLGGVRPLYVACQEGHSECVRLLMEATASVDSANDDEGTALMAACEKGHTACAALLLGSGASANLAKTDGTPPLIIAVHYGHLDCVKLLSSYNANRRMVANGKQCTAELVAMHRSQLAVADWLVESRDWSSPLHHVEVLTEARARTLLRQGANLHLCRPGVLGAPTPLDLAQLQPQSNAAARLIIRAAEEWSPQNHQLFPAASRLRAVLLLRFGYLIALERYPMQMRSLVDAWRTLVLPRAVER